MSKIPVEYLTDCNAFTRAICESSLFPVYLCAWIVHSRQVISDTSVNHLHGRPWEPDLNLKQVPFIGVFPEYIQLAMLTSNSNATDNFKE